MRIDIRTNLDAVRRDLRQLQSDIRERAIARAINRTVEQGRTQMVRTISEEFRLKQADIRTSLRLGRAREGSFGLLLSAFIEAYGSRRGRGFNLTRFLIGNAQKQIGKRKGQLAFQIKRYGGRKQVPGAFVLNKPGAPVVRRIGKERLPIKGVTTIDVPQMFNTKRINSKVVAFMRGKFPEILQRELAFYIAKARR